MKSDTLNTECVELQYVQTRLTLLFLTPSRKLQQNVNNFKEKATIYSKSSTCIDSK